MKPNLTKAAWNDGYLGRSWIALAVLTVIMLLLFLGVLPSEAIYYPVFGSLMALMALLFVWRLILVLLLFRRGKVVEGIVERISMFRDRGVVTFFFILGETFVKAKQPIMRNKTTLALTPGQKVQILYDEKKLKRALILELYRD